MDGDLRRNFSSQSCTSTDFEGSADPWWSLDLAKVREVLYVRVFSRQDDGPEWTRMLDNFSVHIGLSLSFSPDSRLSPVSLSLSPQNEMSYES